MRILLALAPVVLFLFALWAIDSYKLVRPRTVAAAMGAGALAALLSRSLDPASLVSGGVSRDAYHACVAPVTEETLKACGLLFFVVRRRVGFLVDAAVLGFGVGAGFALVENGQYLWSLPAGSLLTWIVRGVGTALLHGATTSIFALSSKALMDRHPDRRILPFLPGWLAATVMHSAFNQNLLPAFAETLILLLVLPLVVLWVFERSERATRDWVVGGLDLDLELWRLVRSTHFESTRYAQYLQRLRQHLPGPVVLDMYCLLRLEIEVAIQAKALLMAREAGVEIPADPDRRALLAEVRYLRRSIGKMGLMALRPLRLSEARDRWHRFLLETGP